MKTKREKIKQNIKANETFETGELKEFILRSLAACLIVGGTIVFPKLPIVLSIVVALIKDFTNKDIPQQKIKRVLKSLEKRKIVAIERKNNEVYVHIKNQSSREIMKYSLQGLLDFKKKKKNWNKKWFMVFFDIPEEEKKKRDYLRNFLREIGFYQYQKSVYIFPYECEYEIGEIKKIVESGKYMSYIIAEKIEYEEVVKRHFNL